MGGFLSGLGTLLGGFNVARRIDDEGFDFREADQARQFERDRIRELAGQQDEDRMIGQVGDVLVGQGPEMDLDAASSVIPEGTDDASRQRAVQIAMGQIQERKSRIQSGKDMAALVRKQLGGDQRLDEIEARGDEKQDAIRLKAKVDAEMPLTAEEARRWDEYSRRTDIMAEIGRGRNAVAASRPGPVAWQYDYDAETGQRVRRPYTPEMVGEILSGDRPPPSAPGSTELNRIAASRNSLQLGEQLLSELQSPELANALGPIMGRYKTLEAAVGAGDPTARYLHGSLKSLAALQPQIHGFRAIRFAEDIDNYLLQTSQSPQALAAAIQGLLQASRAVGDVDLYQFMPEDFQQYAGAFQSSEGAGRGAAMEDLAAALAAMSPEERAAFLGE